MSSFKPNLIDFSNNDHDDDTPMNFESWDDKCVNLDRKLLRGIYSYGFEKPSPIQKQAVIPMTIGRDVIAQAQSGTGKTGAFTVGTLQLIDHSKPETQAIILSPTRELSRQTYDVLCSLSTLLKTNIKLLIGGTSTESDIVTCVIKPLTLL